MQSGTYKINKTMLDELNNSMVHLSGFATLIGYNIAQDYNLPSYVINLKVVDEMDDIAKVAGLDGV